MSRIAGVKECA